MDSRASARSREDLLARVFYGSTQGMAVGRLDDGRFLEVNDAFLFLIGRSREELAGASVFDLGLWSGLGDEAVVRTLLQERGAIAGIDTNVTMPAGEVRVLRLSAEVIQDDAEPCVIVRAADVAGRVEAGARYHELRETEIKYRALVEQVPAVIYTEIRDEAARARSRTTYVSPQASAILGYAPEEFLADPELWQSRTHPDDVGWLVDEEVLADRAGQPFRAEYRMVARDGRVVWIRDEAVRIEDPIAGIRLWQGLMVDITEEKRARELAQEAEAKYRALIEQIPAIVYLGEFGEDGDWLYISPQIARVMGYAPEEWLAHPHPMASFTHPDDLAKFREAEDRCYRTGEPFSIDYRMTARDGRTVWLLNQGTAVRDEEGRPLYLQGVMYDMTERKKAEEALEEALRREREASERLRALDDAKNTLLHTLSHDLRGPLSAILGAATTLEQPELTATEEERRELLHGMAVRAKKMDRLLADLLDLDRLDRGIVEPNRSRVDVGAIVTDLIRECGDVLDGHEIEVHTEPVVAAVDPSTVERIVENLLSNAVRHTPGGARVWVRVEPVPGGALIAVEDEGPGVPDELKEAVFEPFRRGPDASQGTGIGLSLVARFAGLHGGRAWVEDRADGGASFRVLLPDGDPEAGSAET